MNDAAEIIGRLHEAVGYVRLARQKIDGARCLMQASGQYKNDGYLRTEAEEIALNLWVELDKLRELADKCASKA